jgi:antirestriction protein ArdC
MAAVPEERLTHMPVNGATSHDINVLLLAMTSFALGGDPRFCSYMQASERGWRVRKGERGMTVFFFQAHAGCGSQGGTGHGGSDQSHSDAARVGGVQRCAN